MKHLISIQAILWGVSAHASLTVSPSYVNFGTVETNGLEHSQTVNIYNFGNESVSLSFMDTCSFDFDITHYACFGSLGPNQSCSARIAFSPQAAGNQSCTLYISGGTSFQSVSIHGAGAADEE